MRVTGSVLPGVFVMLFGGAFLAAGLGMLRGPDVGGAVYAASGLFGLVGVGLFVAGVTAFRSQQRYGAAVLELDTVPIVIGGELVGRVRIERNLPTGAHVVLHLAMLHVVSAKNAEETVLWTTKTTATCEAAGTVEVRIAIPADLEKRAKSNHWQLRVEHQPQRGAPLQRTFTPLPVFARR
jgi:hypothetical protein